MATSIRDGYHYSQRMDDDGLFWVTIPIVLVGLLIFAFWMSHDLDVRYQASHIERSDTQDFRDQKTVLRTNEGERVALTEPEPAISITVQRKFTVIDGGDCLSCVWAREFGLPHKAIYNNLKHATREVTATDGSVHAVAIANPDHIEQGWVILAPSIVNQG